MIRKRAEMFCQFVNTPAKALKPLVIKIKRFNIKFPFEIR